MQLLKYSISCLVLFTVLSCSKMNHTYEKFIKDGPIVYPGRADSVLAQAGKERMLLSWAIPSDLNITGYQVFWNFGGDSLAVPGRKPGTGDSVKLYIGNLPEGSYSFTVYSYDRDGHRSVGTHVIGNVYGNVFASTIFNRPISSMKKEETASRVLVAWVGLDAKCAGTEWTYTDINGQPASFFSPLADSTILTGCDVKKPVSYRSLFLPEPKAIDTFYTAFKTL